MNENGPQASLQPKKVAFLSSFRGYFPAEIENANFVLLGHSVH